MRQPSYLTYVIVSVAHAQETVAIPPPTPREYLRAKADSVGLFDLASEIIRRESGWHPEKCNESTADKCNAGQGLFMVIPSTERTCEKHFEKEMDMLDPYDNIDCGYWLLTARGARKGIGHWDNFGIPIKGKQWGSGPYNLAKFGL